MISARTEQSCSLLDSTTAAVRRACACSAIPRNSPPPPPPSQPQIRRHEVAAIMIMCIGVGSCSLPHRRTCMSCLRTAGGCTLDTQPSFSGAQQRCQRHRHFNNSLSNHTLTGGMQPLPTPMSNTSARRCKHTSRRASARLITICTCNLRGMQLCQLRCAIRACNRCGRYS